MSETELHLNKGTFVHLVRESGEELYLDGFNTQPYEKYNPMGLRYVETRFAYRESDYGVLDLYVFRDKYNALWGAEMYRGLGKHDEYYEILQITNEIGSLDIDPTETEDWEPLVLHELVRKATYTYEKRNLG